MPIKTLLPLILALVITPAGAAMFKWKDEHGNTQYGQYPPAGVQAERITPQSHKPSQPADTSSPQQRLKELEQQQQEKAQSTSDAAKEAQREQLIKENCENARKNLAILQEGGHHRVRLPDGTITYLTDEQKQQRIEEAEKQIAEYCK